LEAFGPKYPKRNPQKKKKAKTSKPKPLKKRAPKNPIKKGGFKPNPWGKIPAGGKTQKKGGPKGAHIWAHPEGAFWGAHL